MQKRISAALFILVTATVLLHNGCSTDIDLTAPHKVTPVITGVLDPDADTQFVRINRTYLADSDINTYAGVKDSVEYPIGDVRAWLYKVNQSLVTVDSIELTPIELPSRNPGVFYDTNVLFYHTTEPLFTANELNNITNFTYELRAEIQGQTYTARTDFPQMRTNTIVVPTLGPNPNKLEFARLGPGVSFPLPVTVTYRYNLIPNGVRYQGDVVLVYDEVLSDGTVRENLELPFRAGNFEGEQGDGSSGTQEFNFNALPWFTFVGNHFNEVENLQQVRIHHLAFRLSAANRELNTYISVTNPISSFVPVFTVYSNFDNDAIGVLGSKRTLDRIAWLTEASLNYLNNSEVSGDNSYCVYFSSAGYACN